MNTVRHRLARPWLTTALGLAAWLAAAPSMAATCTLDVQGVSFGSYDFLSIQNLTSVGHVIVTCDVSASYVIKLSPGAGSYATRLMQSGTQQLQYNLYTDVTHSTVWGDGSAGTMSVSGSGTNVDYPVYGSIPAGQTPYVGSYSDTVIVTLEF